MNLDMSEAAKVSSALTGACLIFTIGATIAGSPLAILGVVPTGIFFILAIAALLGADFFSV